MARQVTDMDDPDLDEPGPVHGKHKERRMAKKHEDQSEHEDQGEHGDEERHGYVLVHDVQIAGVAHKKGETVMLTKEEYDVLASSGALAGGEEPSFEERNEKVQEHHKALSEAQKQRIEEGPETPEGADEPKEESAQEKADREAREQTDPNAGLRPPVPTPPRSV
jgi:hypothetical protein